MQHLFSTVCFKYRLSNMHAQQEKVCLVHCCDWPRIHQGNLAFFAGFLSPLPACSRLCPTVPASWIQNSAWIRQLGRERTVMDSVWGMWAYASTVWKLFLQAKSQCAYSMCFCVDVPYSSGASCKEDHWPHTGKMGLQLVIAWALWYDNRYFS